jgi:hypothetical protein
MKRFHLFLVFVSVFLAALLLAGCRPSEDFRYTRTQLSERPEPQQGYIYDYDLFKRAIRMSIEDLVELEDDIIAAIDRDGIEPMASFLIHYIERLYFAQPPGWEEIVARLMAKIKSKLPLKKAKGEARTIGLFDYNLPLKIKTYSLEAANIFFYLAETEIFKVFLISGDGAHQLLDLTLFLGQNCDMLEQPAEPGDILGKKIRLLFNEINQEYNICGKEQEIGGELIKHPRYGLTNAFMACVYEESDQAIPYGQRALEASFRCMEAMREQGTDPKASGRIADAQKKQQTAQDNLAAAQAALAAAQQDLADAQQALHQAGVDLQAVMEDYGTWANTDNPLEWQNQKAAAEQAVAQAQQDIGNAQNDIVDATNEIAAAQTEVDNATDILNAVEETEQAKAEYYSAFEDAKGAWKKSDADASKKVMDAADKWKKAATKEANLKAKHYGWPKMQPAEPGMLPDECNQMLRIQKEKREQIWEIYSPFGPGPKPLVSYLIEDPMDEWYTTGCGALLFAMSDDLTQCMRGVVKNCGVIDPVPGKVFDYCDCVEKWKSILESQAEAIEYLSLADACLEGHCAEGYECDGKGKCRPIVQERCEKGGALGIGGGQPDCGPFGLRSVSYNDIMSKLNKKGIDIGDRLHRIRMRNLDLPGLHQLIEGTTPPNK